ncbi:hypothetical protein D3D02_06975 [Halobellus sp. Atlit-38R]|nr:hypothetical protein D3D02_06975 [Halobellus sp. Atlit-38R]
MTLVPRRAAVVRHVDVGLIVGADCSPTHSDASRSCQADRWTRPTTVATLGRVRSAGHTRLTARDE